MFPPHFGCCRNDFRIPPQLQTMISYKIENVFLQYDSPKRLFSNMSPSIICLLITNNTYKQQYDICQSNHKAVMRTANVRMVNKQIICFQSNLTM